MPGSPRPADLGRHSLRIELCAPIEDHARLVMAWRNDEQTLAMSYHHDPKQWSSFWPEFRDTYFLHPDLPPMFVGTASERVAFIRFLPFAVRGRTDRVVDISINLDPAQRGKGLSAPSILTAVAHLFATTDASLVIAEVRLENTASHRAFVSAGFEVIEEAIHVVEDTGERCPILRYGAARPIHP